MTLKEIRDIIFKTTEGGAFKEKVVYLSMEYAIDQALKIYSGGLGYLSGSHMKSAYELEQPLVGVGILWDYGYYDQTRDQYNEMQVSFVKRSYSFLIDTSLVLEVIVSNTPVKVKVWFLPPDTFNTVPLFLLSTKVDGNDFLSKSITDHLYDANDLARIAASIVLGAGAFQLMQAIGVVPDKWHLNEAHGLPLLFKLYERYQNLEDVRRRAVFTTHTPERAGNEQRPLDQLKVMSFFGGLTDKDIDRVVWQDHGQLCYTETAIKMTGRQNAVSEIHRKVCVEELFSHMGSQINLIGITNAQNIRYWQDVELAKWWSNKDFKSLRLRKKNLKIDLFKRVADQCGKLLDPDILTIVWARRFAGYKRPALLLRDMQRLEALTLSDSRPVQIIFAGKPYPFSEGDIEAFRYIQRMTAGNRNIAVLTGYELELSAMLKKGADVWLNTPRFKHEASGTSGMTAAMNACINVSIADGWVGEFAKHMVNAVVIPHKLGSQSDEDMDSQEYEALMGLLENEVKELFYGNPSKWDQMIWQSMNDVVQSFSSHRMATEYYEKLYA